MERSREYSLQCFLQYVDNLYKPANVSAQAKYYALKDRIIFGSDEGLWAETLAVFINYQHLAENIEENTGETSRLEQNKSANSFNHPLAHIRV